MDHFPEVPYEAFLFQVRQFFQATQSADIISRMILNRIFEHLPLKDIQNCRLVSRRWKGIAARQWVAKSLVTFYSVDKINEYITQFQNNTIGCHPNFRIYATIHTMEPMMRFFTMFGPQIKSLELRKCFHIGRNFPILVDTVPNLERLVLVGRISSEDCIYPNLHFQDVQGIVEMSKKLHWPKLKYLRVDLGGYNQWTERWSARDDAIKIQPFVFQLLMACPNLEILAFYALNNEQYFPRMMYHLLLSRHEVQLKHLSKIELMPRRAISTNELHLLQVKVYPIVDLDLDVNCVRTGLNSLHGMLASLERTLKKLRVRYVDPEGGTLSRYFPSSRFLQRLKSLSLINFMGNVGFVVELTKLQYLYMNHDTVNSSSIVFGGLEPGKFVRFPIELRIGSLRNREDILDREMYLIR